jgi:glycosyltransferase involved in cell wall biosynthesis
MKLSVIIACYNGADTIATQLEALADQRWPERWEVIVVDNRSTDRSMAIVEGYRNRLPNLRIVDAWDRQGQAYALNVGVRNSTGEALLFCDADDQVAPGWLAAMGRALSEHDFVACRFDTDRLNAPWVAQSHPNPQRDGLNRYRYPPYLPHAGGCGLGVRRSHHEAIGGFDESIPIVQDTDYCWRLQRAGIELHFVPDAVLYVRYRSTLRGLYRQARGYGMGNVLLYKRYRPLGMPPLARKDGVAAWRKLLWTLPRIRGKAAFARWTWDFAWRVGRLEGSIKYRVFAL